jgi:sugar phosphate isomerase/epimerase
MMTYTMSRQGFSLKDIIQTAVDLELEGIDWVTTYGYAANELRKMSSDAGLTVVCHTFFCDKLTNGESDWLDEVKQSVEDAVMLDAPIVMIPTCCKPGLDRDSSRDFWINALLKIAPVTDNAGITLTIENFPGSDSAFITAADYYKAKTILPQLKLTYDNGNAAFGEDPVESFRLSVEDVVHAHFKDWYISNQPEKGCLDSIIGKYFRPALIGEGDIDTAACWNIMRDSNYSGFINIEYESSDIPAAEAMSKAVKYLRSL